MFITTMQSYNPATTARSTTAEQGISFSLIAQLVCRCRRCRQETFKFAQN